jgi:hypothetical protein
MPGAESETGRQKGSSGKLIAESCGGPAHDSIGYLETLLEYYLPGVNHKTLSDKAFAQKLAHLQFIRQQISEGKDD